MTTRAEPVTLLRSRSYLGLLLLAALLGVPVSASAYGFLALVSYLQKELFTRLPHGLGFVSTPRWWPLPVLLAGGVLAGLAISYLPGNGGPSPAAASRCTAPRHRRHCPVSSWPRWRHCASDWCSAPRCR